MFCSSCFFSFSLHFQLWWQLLIVYYIYNTHTHIHEHKIVKIFVVWIWFLFLFYVLLCCFDRTEISSPRRMKSFQAHRRAFLFLLCIVNFSSFFSLLLLLLLLLKSQCRRTKKISAASPSRSTFFFYAPTCNMSSLTVSFSFPLSLSIRIYLLSPKWVVNICVCVCK